MTLRQVCFTVVGLLLTGPAMAEETEVYESLPEVVVGKVFFSQSERERLDERGASNPVHRGSGRTHSGRKIDPNAAGFWASSDGPTKVYVAGDFVDASSVENKTFPGDVSIRSRQDSEPDETGDAEE